MALDANIRGAASGTAAEVTTANYLKVITETNAISNPGNIGGMRIFSENDPGSITGIASLRSPETSADYRLRVGTDTLTLDHTFVETTLDTTKWKIPILPVGTPAAPTVTLSGGFLTLNAAGTTTSTGAHITFQSQRVFRIRATSPLYVEIIGNLTAIPITNQVFEIGMFTPTGTTAPADGIYFQLTSAGIIGAINYAGSVTQTGVLVAPGSILLGQNVNYLVIVNTSVVQFWINNILYGEVVIPAGQAVPFLTDALPIGFQYRNSGAVAGTGQSLFRVGDVGVTVGDIATNRTWPAQMSGMGHHASQFQSGNASTGTSASLPNATAATTVTGATLSQTVPIKAVATGGFGGEASLTAAVPGLDGMVWSFQNPVGSTTQPPRNMTIMGVTITASNQGAIVATTGTTVQWALAYGATGTTVPSLAQAEVTTLTALTVKQYRRIPLGQHSFPVGAALGQQANNLTLNFGVPVTLYPGEWLAITGKFVFGTATASQIIWCTAMIDAHFD